MDRYEPTREDVLIGRVVDAEATPADWGELEHLAKGDGSLWQRLAQAQRAHARLERAVEDEIAIAELVELPEPPSVIASFRSRWQTWGGWAAAAALALAWLGAGNGPLAFRPAGGPGGNTAGLAPSLDGMWQQYIDSGKQNDRVINEMPLQLVDSRELEGGRGYEMIYVRPVLEKKVVTDVRRMRVVKDDSGAERTVLDPRPLQNVDVLIRSSPRSIE